jgi:hypothetical protein
MSKNKDWGSTKEFQEDSDMKQTLNIEAVAFRTFDRKAIAHISGDETSYENAIEELIDQLPLESQEKVEEYKEECTYIVPVWYQDNFSKIWGLSDDPHNPAYRNKKGIMAFQNYDPELMGRRWEITKDEDGNEVVEEIIEKGGPIQISPLYREDKKTDIVKLSRFVHNEYQRIGLTWKLNPHDYQRPNPNYKPKKKKIPPPNPLFEG